MGTDPGDEYLPGGGSGTEDSTDIPGGTGGDGTRGDPDPAKRYGIATIGDVLSEGGAVLGGSTDVLSEKKGVVRENDQAYCAQHGVTTVDGSTCAEKIKANNKKVALCGYTKMICGDMIIEAFKTVKGVP